MISIKNIALLLTLLYGLFIGKVSSHGAMVKPHSWFDFEQSIPTADGSWMYDYIGMKSGLQCFAGCAIPIDVICPKGQCDGYHGYPGCACMWYTNYTQIQKPTIFDPKLRTYDIYHPGKRLFHPWRAPGSAPIDSPCGVSGGNFNGCFGGNCSQDKGGFGHGPKAEKVHFLHHFYKTNWTRGGIVDVAWSITANHGGGYSYRLCKLPQEGVQALSEECFQQTPLEFVGDKQWVQYGEDESTRLEIPAIRVSKGTTPKGSQWTKNPIPACIGSLGGFYYPTADCPKGTQFTPSKPDLYGFGTNIKNTVKPFQFSIVDKIRIPKGLEPGNYVLSFRWDAEQTPQVWNTCASIALS